MIKLFKLSKMTQTTSIINDKIYFIKKKVMLSKLQVSKIENAIRTNQRFVLIGRGASSAFF